MLSEAVLQRIETTIAEVNPEAFVVDISLKKGKKSTLFVRVDTDKGISLSECTSISRAIGQLLEEEKELDFAYRLEVSSPGVGFPLKLHRQYVQNIGRHLSVINHGGHEIQGKLLEVEEEHILLAPIVKAKQKNKKAGTAEPKQIQFSEIKESKVIIVF
ncbi:MAG: hypothetical protein AAFQ68_23595 [Bacteroidota bacterium]